MRDIQARVAGDSAVAHFVGLFVVLKITWGLRPRLYAFRLLRRLQSHSFVVWSTAALGGYPVDDLVGIHDVARFAVDAV